PPPPTPPALRLEPAGLRRRADRGFLDSFLQVRSQLLPLLSPAFLHGLDRVVGDLLAALDRVPGRLLGRVDQAIRHVAHLLVFDLCRRDEQARYEADRRGADGEAERVALRRVLWGAHLRAARDRVGCRAGDGILAPGDLVLDSLLLVVDVVADTGRHVGLVA